MAYSGGTIRCTISNCHYWSRGNQCSAAEILVTSDIMSKNLPQTVNAPYASQIIETPVSKKEESCCKTFVLKKDYNQNLDGILKKE